MASAAQKNAVVPFAEYAVTALNPSDLSEIIRENIGDRPLDPSDLAKVKVPSGGGVMWTVDGLEGPEAARYIDGVIIAKRDQRVYWERDRDEEGGGGPPNCYSLDLETGHGTPGGSCADCPFSQFGTAGGGTKRGQACKQQALLFVLTKDGVLPIVIVVPPSSLKAIKSYMLKLSTNAKPYHGVVTRFGLKEEKNGDGTKYAQIEPQFIGTLAPEERAKILPLRSMLATVRIDAPVDAEAPF